MHPWCFEMDAKSVGVLITNYVTYTYILFGTYSTDFRPLTNILKTVYSLASSRGILTDGVLEKCFVTTGPKGGEKQRSGFVTE